MTYEERPINKEPSIEDKVRAVLHVVSQYESIQDIADKNERQLKTAELYEQLVEFGALKPIQYIERVEIRERQPVTPEEKRAYDHNRYMQRKALLAQKKKEERVKAWLSERLSPDKKTFCYICRKAQTRGEPITHEIQTLKDGRQKLLVLSVCPECKGPMRSFGGYVIP